jgi:hypothetical protein
MRLEATRIDSKSKLFRVPSKPRLTFDVVLPLGKHHGPRQLSQVRIHVVRGVTFPCTRGGESIP